MKFRAIRMWMNRHDVITGLIAVAAFLLAFKVLFAGVTAYHLSHDCNGKDCDWEWCPHFNGKWTLYNFVF